MRLRHPGDEQTCQQVLRARHLLTMVFFNHSGEPDNGKSWITWLMQLGFGTVAEAGDGKS